MIYIIINMIQTIIESFRICFQRYKSIDKSFLRYIYVSDLNRINIFCNKCKSKTQIIKNDNDLYEICNLCNSKNNIILL